MTAIALLDNLTSLGVRLSAKSGKLRYYAPRGLLTEEDKALLLQNKGELLELLSKQGSITSTVYCPICSSSLSIEAGRQYVHAWCAQGCHDSWIALEGMKLSDTDAPGFGRGRAMVTAAIARGTCPDCHIPLIHQDREQGILGCGECGVRVVKGEIE